jgi:peptide deformylase
MLKLIKFPDTILREKMPEFDFNNPVLDPKELEKQMLEYMYSHDGIGLAANQVGIRARVFVMGHSANPHAGMAFFNPVIIKSTDTIEDLEEGCLSFPNIYVKIKRPKAIKAQWQNSSGELEEGEFDGYNCKCFLHEFDHLEGITYQDRVSPLKWALAIKKIKLHQRKINAATK